MYKKIISLSLLALATFSSAYAADKNFDCPQPSEIQSTDFTAPSIWTAPAVKHAAKGTVGVGLGGSKAVEFLGAEEAEVNHQKGWVCVYLSDGDKSINYFEKNIISTVSNTPYLVRYSDHVKEELQKAEPYLKNYPHDKPLGFIGYQREPKDQ